MEKIQDPREKDLDPRNIHQKYFGHTEYPREKTSNPRNTHEDTMTR